MKFVLKILVAVVTIVAPDMGAWIEILSFHPMKLPFQSLPTWERGLKLGNFMLLLDCISVAPDMGAWIEIKIPYKEMIYNHGRSRHGSVD